MRKILVCVCAGLLGAEAWAGGLGFMGTYWSTKDFEAGYGAGAKLQIDLTKAVALELRGSYFEDMSQDVLTPAGEVDSDLQVIPLEAGLVLRLAVADAAIHPYIGGGVGYYMLELNTESPGGADATIDLDDEVGWYAVAGLEIKMAGNLALVLEAQYRGVEGTAKDDDIHDIGNDFALDLGGIGANAGLMITW